MRVHVRFANFFTAFCICKFCLILQIRPDILAIKSSPASLHKIYETALKDLKNYERASQARKIFAQTFFISTVWIIFGYLVLYRVFEPQRPLQS